MKVQVENPKVSVIMNCLNGEKYLREAIDSVFAQTYPNWEIIFWDNASTDGSGEIAKSFDSRLVYYRGEATVPLGAARNRAMEKATGEFIAFLDCDDSWFPTKLEKQIPLFQDPEVGLVFSDSILFNESGAWERMFQRVNYHTGRCFSQLITDYFLDIETVVIRRSVLDDEGAGFDPRFSLVEDTDFFCRIGYKWKLAMVNEPLAKWRIHPSSLTWSKGYMVTEEVDVMLAKFSEIIPDFGSRFSREIHQVKMQNSITRAKHLWMEGKSRTARENLIPYLFSSRKAFCSYFITFIPEPKIAPVIKRLRNAVLP